MASTKPILNCPHCGNPLDTLQIHNGPWQFFRCVQHGRFWLDNDGRLREERRSADRPKRSS